MLIGNIVMRDDHVRVYDVDGSHIEYNTEDGLRLLHWLLQRRELLLELYRQELNNERRKDNVS